MGEVIYALARLGLPVLGVCILFAMRATIAAAWREGARAQAAAAQVLVAGGLLSAASFLDNRVVIQAATTVLFVILVLSGEVRPGTRMDSRFEMFSAPALIGPQLPIVLVLLFWFWLFGVNFVFLLDGDSSVAIFRVASGIALAAFIIVQQYRPITLLHFLSASLVTSGAVLIALPFTPDGFVECGIFKCSIAGMILQGPVYSGNILSWTFAVCVILILVAAKQSKGSVFTIAVLLFSIYMTYSRTAFFALACILALYLLPRSDSRKTGTLPTNNAGARVAAGVLSVSSVAVGMALVLMATSEEFSNRGRIWILGVAAMKDRWLFGAGLDSWNVLIADNYFGLQFDHSQHSEYLLVYFAGGIVGVLLLSFIIYRASIMAIVVQGSVWKGLALPMFFTTAGLTETIFNPLSVDQGTWLFYILFGACVPIAPGSLLRNKREGVSIRRREVLRRTTSD